ncbi:MULTISPECIES: hypothetical protein [Pseudoalteromonas]|uniref:Uncharacterized protein n=1 Tax=Pseudoalteromonas luteoviolacea (strain 2ta16) TaxID=1353533 RepID=V4JGY1_PSEL2|nr:MULTISPECIES: hypothetical protein [Pseudoalteromonas]ESP94212.1 hypothetical protein PL2TA16_02349 [Pseudoalteromonas luteoviolacea 2ta16]KZN32867.1 hypothetical protein N483_26780 [Pseudoalteromonas luteoviolacea NCIMB 1944]MCG7550314.1 hypothetical protein [Pseudoalteromonas sp. Of7M-16]
MKPVLKKANLKKLVVADTHLTPQDTKKIAGGAELKGITSILIFCDTDVIK